MKTFPIERVIFCLLCLLLALPSPLYGLRHEHHGEPPVLSVVENVEVQPLLAQALRLDEALSFLGSALSAEDSTRLRALKDKPHTAEITTAIQKILDPYTLAMVDINPEARVKVFRGRAKAELMQSGWTTFLVKIHNKAARNCRN